MQVPYSGPDPMSSLILLSINHQPDHLEYVALTPLHLAKRVSKKQVKKRFSVMVKLEEQGLICYGPESSAIL